MDSEQTAIKFLNINEVENAPDLQPIWGNWLFRDSVVLEVGEPGISKTTWNFGLSKALVDNKPFLGVSSVVKDPFIVYMEFEASASLVKSRMRAMGGYPRCSDRFKLYLREEEFHTMEQISDGIVELGYEPDIVFVDPIRMAFNMRDENDNAEATKQMKAVKKIARRLNCCVVLVHHSSKAELNATKKASGAYSRAALADISINFDRLYDSDGKEIDRDIFAMSIPKNRMIDDDFCICIRKIHDGRGFRVVNFPVGARISYNGMGAATERYTAQQLIYDEIMGQGKVQVKDVMESLAKIGKTYSDEAVYKALGNLVAMGLVDHDDNQRNRNYWKTVRKLPISANQEELV